MNKKALNTHLAILGVAVALAGALHTAQAQRVAVTNGTYLHLMSSSVVKLDSLNIQSGGTGAMEFGSELDVSASLINSGTLTCNTGSTVNFVAGTQYLTGATVFSNLTKSGGGTLTLNSPITANGTLQLSSGKITLGTNNLTIGTSGSISGASSSNFIVTDGAGLLQQTVGESNVLFPFGPADANYNPVTVNNVGTIDVFSGRVQTTFDNPPLDPNSIVNLQWTINEAVPGGSSAALTFQWNTADEAGGFVRTNPIAIGRWTGTQWTASSATYADSDGGVYSAMAAGFDSFSPFAIGSAAALPVQLTSFRATVNRPVAELHWSTATETNNYGFEIERRQIAVGSMQSAVSWQRVGFVAGAGTSSSPKEYSYVERNVTPGRYAYRIKQIDNDGKFSYTQAAEVEVGLAPKEFTLSQNYPNPFNPSTTIEFTLAEDGRTRLKVYNILGEEIASLFDEDAIAGRIYQAKFEASRLPSGVYFARLESNKQQLMKKMLLLK